MAITAQSPADFVFRVFPSAVVGDTSNTKKSCNSLPSTDNTTSPLYISTSDTSSNPLSSCALRAEKAQSSISLVPNVYAVTIDATSFPRCAASWALKEPQRKGLYTHAHIRDKRELKKKKRGWWVVGWCINNGKPAYPIAGRCDI